MSEKKSDNVYNLPRRRLLGGLGAIGLASAGAGVGTSAYFNDTESFDNNTLTAGKFNLIVDWHTYVDQGSHGMLMRHGESGRTTDSVVEGVNAELTDVKPGDSGLLAFCFELDDNPGYLWMCGDLTANDENGSTEPERETEGEALLNDPGTGTGELAQSIQVDVDYCTVDDDVADDGGFTPADATKVDDLFEGTLAQFLDVIGGGQPLDGDGNTSDDESGFLVPGNQECYAGLDDAAAADNACLCIDWQISTEVGNEIQTDSLTFDLEFHAQQCRHNTGTTNPCAREGEVECVACEVDASTVSQSPEVTSYLADPVSFPSVSTFATIDTTAGTDGTIPEANFSICENGCFVDPTVEFTSENKPVDFAFLFDVSSSMGGEIAGMKTNVSNFVTSVETEGIDASYALLAYSDDDSSDGTGDSADGSAVLSDLTSNAGDFQTTVNGLTLSGHGVGSGGDFPEDAFTAIDEAHTDLTWRGSSQRVLIVITDALSESEGSDPTRAEIDGILGGTPGYTLIAVSPDSLGGGNFDMRDVALDNGGLWIDIEGGNFASILTAITDAVATSWRITYPSPQPTADGTTRNVLLTVEDPNVGTLYGKASYTAPT